MPFCSNDVYPNICIPIPHPLWPDWTLNAKDFMIQTEVSLNVE